MKTTIILITHKIILAKKILIPFNTNIKIKANYTTILKLKIIVLCKENL